MTKWDFDHDYDYNDEHVHEQASITDSARTAGPDEFSPVEPVVYEWVSL